MAQRYIGVDIGGTKIAVAVLDGASLGDPVEQPTELGSGEALLQQLTDRILEAADGDQAALVGIGCPSVIDFATGTVRSSVNIPLQHIPLREELGRRTGLEVVVDNDATVAALAEATDMATGEVVVPILTMLTVGTGVGGGIVIGGKVVEGRHSHGGELGHMKIEMTNPRLCGCGRYGCLEAYAGATAIVKRTREALEGDRQGSSLAAVEDLTARDVFLAAASGDALAGRIVEETAYYLAIGAMNAMHVLDPDLVVFGGGMIAAGDGFLERIRRHVRELAFAVLAANTEIRYARLGGDAGFIGAAACARALVAG